MVFSGEVQEAVEDEDADFLAEGVAVGGGLAGGGVEGDGEVAGVMLRDLWGGGEAEDVGGLVLAAKVFVEAAEFGVGGEEELDFTGKGEERAGAVEEAGEGLTC